MRTKLNMDSSTDRRIADKLAMSGMPLSGMPMSSVPTSGIQMEWLDAGNWRLPSGKALAEFALQAGFLAPPLFNVEQFGFAPGSNARSSEAGRCMDDQRIPSRVKPCGKGSGE
jgi:hypothetical protein